MSGPFDSPLTYGQPLKIQQSQPIYLTKDAALPIDVQYRVTADMWIKGYAWVQVISSNVASIAYNEDKETLFVMFQGGKGGSIYAYSSVPIATARDMFNCSSMGKFVHQRLKGRYPYRRILNLREQGMPNLGLYAGAE